MGKRVTVGVLFGVIAGVISGILTSPKSGRETRLLIKQKASQMKKKAMTELSKAKK